MVKWDSVKLYREIRKNSVKVPNTKGKIWRKYKLTVIQYSSIIKLESYNVVHVANYEEAIHEKKVFC